MNKLIAGVMIAALCVVTGVNFIYAQTSFTNSININFPTVSLSTIVWDTSCEDNAWCFDQGVGEASDALGLIQKASDKLNCSKASYGYFASRVRLSSGDNAPGAVVAAKAVNGSYLSCSIGPTQLGFIKYTSSYSGDYLSVVKACLNRDLNTIVINPHTKEVFIGRVE